MENQKFIIRCDRSGVFYGEIAKREGREAVLRNVRQLWYWDGAASLMQLASEGVKKPKNCKFTVPVSEIVVTDVIQILPCTDNAIKVIQAVPVWMI